MQNIVELLNTEAERLTREISALRSCADMLGGRMQPATKGRPFIVHKRRTVSASARRAMARCQRARWAAKRNKAA